VPVERLSRCLPAEGLAGPAVERSSDSGEVVGTVLAQVDALEKNWRSRPLAFSLVPRCQGDRSAGPVRDRTGSDPSVRPGSMAHRDHTGMSGH
jgi:hypothetical protein